LKQTLELLGFMLLHFGQRLIPDGFLSDSSDAAMILLFLFFHMDDYMMTFNRRLVIIHTFNYLFRL
jgi:hypothetical protein